MHNAVPARSSQQQITAGKRREEEAVDLLGHPKQVIDPMGRNCLKYGYRAVLDAGFSRHSLQAAWIYRLTAIHRPHPTAGPQKTQELLRPPTTHQPPFASSVRVLSPLSSLPSPSTYNQNVMVTRAEISLSFLGMIDFGRFYRTFD